MKGGYHHDESDESGFKTAVDKDSVHDLGATILAAAGLDHARLTFKFQGLAQRLTGVENPELMMKVLW
jgi:hypothetical protein